MVSIEVVQRQPSAAPHQRAPTCPQASAISRLQSPLPQGDDRPGAMYYTSLMAMGKRKRIRQPTMWVTTTDLPTAASHPFYRRLNQLLRFDDFVEAHSADFCAETMGRPGLPPGIYFRLLLMGYFEGIDAERGIAWRAADSLALLDFLGLGLDQAPPGHSTISRTRRLTRSISASGCGRSAVSVNRAASKAARWRSAW